MPVAALQDAGGTGADLEDCAFIGFSNYPDPTVRFPAPVAGNLVDLVAQTFAATGGGLTIDLLVNGSSVLQLTFADGEIATKVANGTVPILQGDKVSFRFRRPNAGASWVHVSTSFQVA